MGTSWIRAEYDRDVAVIIPYSAAAETWAFHLADVMLELGTEHQLAHSFTLSVNNHNNLGLPGRFPTNGLFA